MTSLAFFIAAVTGLTLAGPLLAILALFLLGLGGVFGIGSLIAYWMRRKEKGQGFEPVVGARAKSTSENQGPEKQRGDD